MANLSRPLSRTACIACSTRTSQTAFWKDAATSAVYRLPLHLTAVQIVEDGRFQAAEAEIVGRILEFRPGKENGLRISLLESLSILGPPG